MICWQCKLVNCWLTAGNLPSCPNGGMLIHDKKSRRTAILASATAGRHSSHILKEGPSVTPTPPHPHPIQPNLPVCFVSAFAAHIRSRRTQARLQPCQKFSERLTNANPVAGLEAPPSSGYDQTIRPLVTEASNRRSNLCTKSYRTSQIPSAPGSSLA